jgi:hypothetical protein
MRFSALTMRFSALTMRFSALEMRFQLWQCDFLLCQCDFISANAISAQALQWHCQRRNLLTYLVIVVKLTAKQIVEQKLRHLN